MSGTRPEIAFALGGLAGNNAHGAGFLHAALNHPTYDLTPSMISCTTGQIYWVWRYLEARGKKGQARPADPERIRRLFMQDVEALHRFGNINLDYANVAITGRPNVFRPAYNLFQPLINHYTIDLWQNSLLAAAHVFSDPFRTFWLQELLRAYPGRLLIPEFPETFFDDIFTAFYEEEEIGIAFNSYCPKEGVEHVYLNKAARAQLSPDGAKYYPGYLSPTRSFSRNAAEPPPKRTVYQELTRDAVRNGLWIYEYGFDKLPVERERQQFVDGAYYRQIMLKELQPASVIFVARPINARWLPARQGEDLPRSYVEIQDLKTEVNFNGSYVGERAQIALVNDLVARRDAAIEQGALPKDCGFLQDYKHIDLLEIEIQEQRSFFDYVFESPSVFEQAEQGLNRAIATLPRVVDLLRVKP